MFKLSLVIEFTANLFWTFITKNDLSKVLTWMTIQLSDENYTGFVELIKQNWNPGFPQLGFSIDSLSIYDKNIDIFMKFIGNVLIYFATIENPSQRLTDQINKLKLANRTYLLQKTSFKKRRKMEETGPRKTLKSSHNSYLVSFV